MFEIIHDDLWDFEGKSVPVHWHGDLEVSLPREGTAVYQVGQERFSPFGHTLTADARKGAVV